MKVTPSALVAGAVKLVAEEQAVAKVPVPSVEAAQQGLDGFAVAAKLDAADDAVRSALKIAGGRFGIMAKALDMAAFNFTMTDLITPGTPDPALMSQDVAGRLTGMGNMNLSRS